MPRKSRESSTQLRGEGKEKGASAPRGCAARSRVLSWLASLAIKPGFHMIAAIAEKRFSDRNNYMKIENLLADHSFTPSLARDCKPSFSCLAIIK